MNADLASVLVLPAVQNAIIALLIASATLPIVGVFIIGLDIVPVRFAMMHVALLGVAIGMLISVDPMLCAVVLCAAAGALLAPIVGRRGGLSAPMGLLMTLAIALALLVLSISGVNATGAFEWLWGSLLAVRRQELIVLSIIGAVIVAIYLRYRKELALLLFDYELALASGINARQLATLLLVTVSVAIASALPLTGALLVDAVTLLPAMAARNLASSLSSMVRLAIMFGLACNAVGFALALVLNQPPGPILVLVSGLVTLSTFVVGRRA
jgi:zinc transport system permease protein